MSWMKITGYADKFGVHPGDTIKFFVNCDGPSEYQAEIVKMIHGDTNPRGPGFMEEPTFPTCKQECLFSSLQALGDSAGVDVTGNRPRLATKPPDSNP